MDNRKFDLIVDKLFEKTEQEKLKWEKTADKDTFLTVLTDSSISVRQIANENPNWEEVIEPSYAFDFRNENGDIVDSVTVTKSNNEMYKKVEKTFDLARKQSLETDSIVDRILEQLAA